MRKVTTTLRLPEDIAAFLDGEAEENASSRNSEVIRAVRASMKAKGSASVGALPSHGSVNPQQGNLDEREK